MMARLPQGNSGPASPPSGNPGMAAAALAKVREALNLLAMALPDLEPGTDQYKAVADMIQKGSKAVPSSQEVPGIQKTTLMELQQKAQQNAMLQQLQAKMAQGQQAQQAGGQPQPQPQPADAGAPQG